MRKSNQRVKRVMQFETLDKRDLYAGDLAVSRSPSPDTGGTLLVGSLKAPTTPIAPTGRLRAPEIDVRGVVDGQSQVVQLGWGYASSPPTKQFTIANLGNAPLVIRDVQLPTGFTASATSITLAPGQSFVLTIARDIGVGTRQGEIRILSNDADEGVYNFQVRGRVLEHVQFVASTGGLLRPDHDGVFRDFDTRPARSIDITPPTGRVPTGTKYVVTIELANGQIHRYLVGGSVSRFQFSRIAPAVIENLTPIPIRFR